jgi:xanthine dehydrogenase YagS FAD-binding subunit
LKAFTYLNPPSEREAVAALSAERGRILPIAGGMDLLGLMKDFIVSPERLVNVKNFDTSIVLEDGAPARGASTASAQGPTSQAGTGTIRIGAAVKLVDLAEHPDMRTRYPALTSAAEEVGTPQIRNMGTVGGNLMQRPRCWYFRNEEFHCLKKGGARCYAVDGENQYHAIFGDGPCHIVHPSSLAVPIIAYGGRLGLMGPKGAREVDAGEFFQMPAVNLYGETILQPNELVTHVILPPPGQRSATYEVRVKQSHDWPLALASVNLSMDDTTVRAARIVMGGVAPIPWRTEAAERLLVGQSITESSAAEAAAAAVAGATPLSGNAYKIQVAKTAVKRAIMKAARLPVA